VFFDGERTLLRARIEGPFSYCYDALNRETGRAYSAQSCANGQLPSGTAVDSYTYDQGTNGIGHLTSCTDQAGTGS
jgi:hypothetical protein